MLSLQISPLRTHLLLPAFPCQTGDPGTYSERLCLPQWFSTGDNFAMGTLLVVTTGLEVHLASSV